MMKCQSWCEREIVCDCCFVNCANDLCFIDVGAFHSLKDLTL